MTGASELLVLPVRRGINLMLDPHSTKPSRRGTSFFDPPPPRRKQIDGLCGIILTTPGMTLIGAREIEEFEICCRASHLHSRRAAPFSFVYVELYTADDGVYSVHVCIIIVTGASSAR